MWPITRKVGTVILVVSVVVWALSVLPGGSIETRYLARLGHLLAPLGLLMGFDWRLTVALLTSFITQENSIATQGVLFGSGEGPRPGRHGWRQPSPPPLRSRS